MAMSPLSTPTPAGDLPRIALGVLFIGVMIAASLWVLRPFIAATVWAATVVVATWPMMLALESRLGGRRGLAVAVMTGVMLLLLVAPLVLAVSTIADHAGDIVGWAKVAVNAEVPSPPEWVGRIPLVGAKLARRWQQLAAAGREELAVQAAPYVRTGVQWVAGRAGDLGAL